MPIYCCAYKCSNKMKTNKNVSYFSFPNDPERWKQWLTAIDREDLIDKFKNNKITSYRVCSQHFDEHSLTIYKRPSESAVPILRKVDMKLISPETDCSQSRDDGYGSSLPQESSIKVEIKCEVEDQSHSTALPPGPSPRMESPARRLYDSEPVAKRQREADGSDDLGGAGEAMDRGEEFDVFSHHVATQLRALPLRLALEAQDEIQSVLTRHRLKNIISEGHYE